MDRPAWRTQELACGATGRSRKARRSEGAEKDGASSAATATSVHVETHNAHQLHWKNHQVTRPTKETHNKTDKKLPPAHTSTHLRLHPLLLSSVHFHFRMEVLEQLSAGSGGAAVLHVLILLAVSFLVFSFSHAAAPLPLLIAIA